MSKKALDHETLIKAMLPIETTVKVKIFLTKNKSLAIVLKEVTLEDLLKEAKEGEKEAPDKEEHT